MKKSLRKKKSVLFLFTVLTAVALTVAACGKGNNDSASSSAPAASSPSASSASPSASPSESAKPLKVAVVFATGGLGDKSFNDNGFNGIERAKKELGITYDYVEPKELADYETYQRDYAKSGDYALIVGIGYDQVDAITKAAKEFPDQKFLLIDAVVDSPNVASAIFKAQEGSFLAGVVSAQQSKTKKIGIVGGMDIPLINAFVAGYTAGAKYIDPKVDVAVNYVGAWNDANTGKEMAVAMYDKGADIVYGAAGGSGLGVYTAAKEKGKMAIGADMVPSQIPDALYLTTLKKIDNVIFDQVKSLQDGTWKGGVMDLGLKEDAVGYSVEGSKIATPQEFIDKADAIKAKIISGELVVPSELGQVDKFLADNKQ
jgi:basic membrane protein A